MAGMSGQQLDRLMELMQGGAPVMLGDIAAECHRLAEARGKYVAWTTRRGRRQIEEELREWHEYAGFLKIEDGDYQALASEEYGDILHAVLSIGHHMGYDIEAALLGAMQRNRERAGEGGL